MLWDRTGKLLAGAFVAGALIVLVLSACGSSSTPTAGSAAAAGSPAATVEASGVITPTLSASEKAGIDQEINSKMNTSDSSLMLWAIQEGNGPRMVEMARDINLAWYAAQANNWALAEYEINDQLPGNIKKLELRSTKLAPTVDSMLKPAVTPVEDAIKAKDLIAFTTAYDKMTAACNACHLANQQPSIKIGRPTAPAVPNMDFNGN